MDFEIDYSKIPEMKKLRAFTEKCAENAAQSYMDSVLLNIQENASRGVCRYKTLFDSAAIGNWVRRSFVPILKERGYRVTIGIDALEIRWDKEK